MNRVLLIYYKMIPSVKLCALEQLQELQRKGLILLSFCEMGKVTRKHCMECDIVIFLRSSTYLEKKLAKNFIKSKKFLVYILDDDLLEIPDYIDAYAYYASKNVKKNIMDIMKNTQLLLSPSQEILDRYNRYFNKTARIEEPCLFFRDKEEKIKEPIKIGIAASIDRAKDIQDLLGGVFYRLQERYHDRICIQFLGVKPQLTETLNIEYFPYLDSYKDYQTRMLEFDWDIGLAPMPDTEFHKCKHYNKFIEYGSYSIVGVYSDVKPYNVIVEDGINGLLCKNTEDAWYEAICSLIDDTDTLCRIRSNVNHQMKTRFHIEKVAEEYLEAVPEFINYHGARKKGFPTIHLKVMDFILHSANYVARKLNYIWNSKI